MESDNPDIYLAMLQYSKANPTSGAPGGELETQLEQLDYSFERERIYRVYRQTFSLPFYDETDPIPEREYRELDAYFQLMEHDEMVQARESASDAKTLPIWAIIFAGLLAFASIVIQVVSFLVDSLTPAVRMFGEVPNGSHRGI